MPIIWTNGFEDLATAESDNGARGRVAGWDYFVSGTPTSLPTYRSTNALGFSTAAGYRSGLCVSLASGLPTDSATSKVFYGRTIQSNSNSYGVAWNMRVNTIVATFAFGMFDNAGNNVYLRVQAVTGLLQLYVNGSLVQTGTVNVFTGNPWTHIELRIVGLNTYEVWVNNNPDMTHTGANFSATSFRMFSDKTSGSPGTYNDYQFDDFIHYTDRPRVGSSKCYGYLRGSDVSSTFNDGDQSAATSMLNEFRYAGYRSSGTRGQQDLISYTNVLPAGTDFTGILAVNQITLATGNGPGGAPLEQVVVVGGNTFATDVTNRVQNRISRINRILENNPNTGSAWTAAQVQAIQTGYRVPNFGLVAFTTQPSATGSNNTNLAQQPVVEVRNFGGAVDTSYNGPVRLFADGAGVLTSLGVVNAVNGVATFSGIAISGVGVTRLTAFVKGRQTATSNNITIS